MSCANDETHDLNEAVLSDMQKKKGGRGFESQLLGAQGGVLDFIRQHDNLADAV